MFGHGKRNESRTFAVQGALVAAPPPVERRIFAVPSSVAAFANEGDTLPLKEVDKLHYFHKSDTIFGVRDQLGGCALQYIDKLFDSRADHGHRDNIITVLSAVPLDQREVVFRRILSDPGFDIVNRVTAIENYAMGVETEEQRQELGDMAWQMVDELLHKTAATYARDIAAARLLEVLPQVNIPEYVELVLETYQLEGWLKLSVIDAMPRETPEEEAVFIERKKELLLKVITSPSSSYNTALLAFKMLPDLPDESQNQVRERVEAWASRVQAEIVDTGNLERQRASKIEKLLHGFGDTAESEGVTAHVLPLSENDLREDALRPQTRGQHMLDRCREVGMSLGMLSLRPLSRSPLHQKASRRVEKFTKSGTETYILPKDTESSVRVMPIEAASTWVDVFEDWPKWYEAGFNYVPVEPIQAIYPTDKAGETAVVTTNLRGVSYVNAKPHFLSFLEQLARAEKTIRRVLGDMGVSHGHLHENNFVVVPFLDESGRIDMTRCPRLYVIDFDQAKRNNGLDCNFD